MTLAACLDHLIQEGNYRLEVGRSDLARPEDLRKSAGTRLLEQEALLYFDAVRSGTIGEQIGTLLLPALPWKVPGQPPETWSTWTMSVPILSLPDQA